MTDRHALIQPDKGQPAIPLHLVDKAGLDAFVKVLNPAQRAALAAQRFVADGYQHAILPDGEGWFAVSGVADAANLSSWCMTRLAEVLPTGTYRRHGADPGKAAFGWALAQYRFDRYRTVEDGKPDEGPRILLSNEVKAIPGILAEVAATTLVRDLVNTPAEDMGPAQLEQEVQRLAKTHHAEVKVHHGDALERGFPLIHAVGRAAARSHAARMVELFWGNPEHPRIALVGKGICFDTGGLDIKPGASMLLMKKDMGGAAHAIALAGLVMAAGLKVRLHLLIPAAENAISGNALRPGDVVSSRKGLTVEIGNTDAEGRLVVADALARAGEENPELIIDFATLTGAARVALGPDLPALMARNEESAKALLAAGKAHDDPCWPLPLFDGYREYLKSDIADINNNAANGFAGAIAAGLFLDRFVPEGIDWMHFDTFAWRPVLKPGRPRGGEALGLRAAWGLLRERFG